MSSLPPYAVVMVGGLLVPFVRGALRPGYLLALPVAAFLLLLQCDSGSHAQLEVRGQVEVTPNPVDETTWGRIRILNR